MLLKTELGPLFRPALTLGPWSLKQAPLIVKRKPLLNFCFHGTICSMKTECSKCQKPNDRLPQRYCRACHAAYMRTHRPRHVDLPEESRRRANARSYVNVYQRRGKIFPEPCSVCQDPVAQKHHEDYNKPLEVRWLCRRCHLKHHQLTLHVEPKLK